MSHSPNESCLVEADRSVFLQIRSPTLFTHMDTLVPGDTDKLFIWERNSLPSYVVQTCIYSHIFVSYTYTLSSIYMKGTELEQVMTDGRESLCCLSSFLSFSYRSVTPRSRLWPSWTGLSSLSRNFSHKTLVCRYKYTELRGSIFLQTLSCF